MKWRSCCCWQATEKAAAMDGGLCSLRPPSDASASPWLIFLIPPHQSIVCSVSLVSEGGGFTASLATMASNLPIPRPPRSPTPPSDDSPISPDPSAHLAASPASYNRDSLSPLVDTFPPPRSPLGAIDSNHLSPTKSSSSPNLQNGSNGNGSSGPFNFATVSMAKSPVVKSVSIERCYFGLWGTIILTKDTNLNRISANAVGISTSIVAYRTKYSSSPLPGRHWLCPTRYRYRRLRNTALVCPEIRNRGFGGVSATCSWPHIHSGALKGRWP